MPVLAPIPPVFRHQYKTIIISQSLDKTWTHLTRLKHTNFLFWGKNKWMAKEDDTHVRFCAHVHYSQYKRSWCFFYVTQHFGCSLTSFNTVNNLQAARTICGPLFISFCMIWYYIIRHDNFLMYYTVPVQRGGIYYVLIWCYITGLCFHCLALILVSCSFA